MRDVVVVRDVVAVVQVVVVLLVVVVAVARGRYIGDFLVVVVRTQFFSFCFALAFFCTLPQATLLPRFSLSLSVMPSTSVPLSLSLPVRPSIQFEAI